MVRPPAHPPRRRDGSVRVLNADSQPLFRDSLARALERHPWFELVERVDDAAARVEAALERTRADVALVDERLLPSDRLPQSTARLRCRTLPFPSFMPVVRRFRGSRLSATSGSAS
jgi:DNA-binding NarL/FixJ family response regulator